MQTSKEDLMRLVAELIRLLSQGSISEDRIAIRAANTYLRELRSQIEGELPGVSAGYLSRTEADQLFELYRALADDKAFYPCLLRVALQAGYRSEVVLLENNLRVSAQNERVVELRRLTKQLSEEELSRFITTLEGILLGELEWDFLQELKRK